MFILNCIKLNVIFTFYCFSVDISSVEFTNIHFHESVEAGIMLLQNFNFTHTNIDKILFNNVKLNKFMLIQNTDLIFQIVITNWYFNEVYQSGSNSLFEVGTVSSITFNNNTFIGISNSILRINKIDLSLGMDSQISNMQISNSSAVAIQFGNFINPTIAVQTMLVENITYSNSTISTSIDLINTENIVTSASVNMVFNNLKFDGIQFSSKGNMLALKHKMVMPVTINNSSFLNLESAVINEDSSGSRAIGLIMQTKFLNCIFNKINGKYSSLINTNNEAVLEFTNSTFTNIYTYEEGAVLYAGFEKTSVSFTNWVFQNNSAVQGTIFVIESESFVKWTNCTFVNNFSITNTIFITSLNGYFEFYNSSIYNNYAINNPVGEILDSANLWILSSVAVYGNQALTVSDISTEFIIKWNYLWFVTSNFISYANTNNLLIASTLNASLVQLILSSLSIQVGSSIKNQDILFNIFLSALSISNSQLLNLKSNIQMSSSNLTIENTQITNVTNIAGTDFIFANLDSILTVNSSSFSNSSSSFMNLRSSQVMISNLTLTNIASPSLLSQIVSSTKAEMSSINVVNWTASNGIFFDFETSSNLSLSGFAGSQAKSWFLQILGTNVTQINSFAIDYVNQPLIVKSSIINVISNSSFTNNGNSTLKAGGAISMSDSKISIINSKFINNIAISGGAISFECTSLDSCNLNINTTTFSSNRATSQGGAIYYNYNRPTISNTIFSNNNAYYGYDFASYAVRVVMDGNMNPEMTIFNAASGIQYDQEVKFSLIDYYNQTMSLNSVNQITINPVNKTAVSMKGTNSGLLRNGVATFNNLIFNTQPGSTNIQFIASSKAIDSVKVKEVYGSVSNNLISVNFRFCKPGEIQLSDNTCSTWATGTFSLDWNSTECEPCPSNAQWLGGNQISVSAGYWRMSQNTSKIVEWIYDKAWDGGYVDQENAPVNWATGYTGILWNEWQIANGIKYSKVSDFECSKWPSPVYNAIRVAGLAILVFAFIFLITFVNIHKTQESQFSILLRI